MVLRHIARHMERRRRRALLRAGRPRLSTTARVGLAALVVIGLAGALLGRHGPDRDATAFIAHARAEHHPPLDLVLRGARARRIVLLGLDPAAPASLRFAGQVLERMAEGPGVDVVVVQADADAQPAFDRFLETPGEDASALLSLPQQSGGEQQGGMLDIYRAVWRLNRKLGADRRIRILAADLPAWAAGRPLSPDVAVRLYSERDAFMANRIEAAVFQHEPNARILVLTGGLHVLRGWATAVTGGGRPRSFNWLGRDLETRHPGDVFSVLTDGPESTGPAPRVARYGRTRFYTLLRDAGEMPGRFALPIDAGLDSLPHPLTVRTAPGVELTLQPPAARLSDEADVYVFLGAR